MFIQITGIVPAYRALVPKYEALVRDRSAVVTEYWVIVSEYRSILAENWTVITLNVGFQMSYNCMILWSLKQYPKLCVL